MPAPAPCACTDGAIPRSSRPRGSRWRPASRSSAPPPPSATWPGPSAPPRPAPRSRPRSACPGPPWGSGWRSSGWRRSAACRWRALPTASAALSPTFWWFVAIFALGRPLLSATNTVAGVVAAEETASRDRAKAISLITAGYAVGAGLTALLRGALGDQLGFRGLFALAVVPLAVTPLIARGLKEPDRYQRLRTGAALGASVGAGPAASSPMPPPRVGGLRGLWVAGRVRVQQRPRLWLLTGLTFSFSFVIGPMNTFLFVYAENALGMSRRATALMVLAAGPLGLVGLLVGRWTADSVGRRRTAAVGQ